MRVAVEEEMVKATVVERVEQEEVDVALATMVVVRVAVHVVVAAAAVMVPATVEMVGTAVGAMVARAEEVMVTGRKEAQARMVGSMGEEGLLEARAAARVTAAETVVVAMAEGAMAAIWCGRCV